MFALSIVTRAKKVLNGQLQSFNITNQISTSNHGIRKKPKKPLPRDKRKKMSRVTVQRKKKKVFWVKKKEKTNLVLLPEKNQGVLSQWQKKTKKPSANTAMLRLLKCSTLNNGAKYRINLNR